MSDDDEDSADSEEERALHDDNTPGSRKKRKNERRVSTSSTKASTSSKPSSMPSAKSNIANPTDGKKRARKHLPGSELEGTNEVAGTAEVPSKKKRTGLGKRGADGPTAFASFEDYEKLLEAWDPDNPNAPLPSLKNASDKKGKTSGGGKSSGARNKSLGGGAEGSSKGKTKK